MHLKQNKISITKNTVSQKLKNEPRITSLGSYLFHLSYKKINITNPIFFIIY